VAPALSRLAARLLPARGATSWPRPAPAGLLLFAPLVALALVATVFVPLWYARAPLRPAGRLQLSLEVAAIAAVLPFAILQAAALWPALSLRRALTAAALLLGAPAAALVLARWRSDFQFVRWSDAIVLGAMAVALVPLRRLLVGRRATVRWALVATAAAVVLTLAAGASEPARKAASTRAGLAAPLLDSARVALDFDHDGYPWLLGGGDCNDRDPTINPGAEEWPDDGIDQNCDGKDASAAALRAPPLAPVPDAVPRDLNILLVTIDTLRADHLGCYGYARPTSPEIDALAAQGTLFTNGWAHAPSTRYSMPAIATGRWPSAIAWDESIFWPRIGTGQRTIGQALKALGYYTGAYYAYSYFARGDARGFERGIDDYQDRRASLHTNVAGPQESVGSSSKEMADDGIAFLDHNRDRKFFLWLHFYDPHLDYQRHPEAPRFGAAPADLYDGEIWFSDHHLGRVLARLKELGLWERTAIVLTGDHGEGLGEHGIHAHGYHLYPAQTRVPFIVRVPGLPPRHESTPVGHVDIAPTLVNLARGSQERSFLGRSMLDLVAGAPPASPPKPVLQDFDYESTTSMHGTRRRGLVTASHHLIWNWTPENTTECYDLRADPGELRDLWGTAPGAPCRPLKAGLQDLVQVLSLPPDFAEKLAYGVSGHSDPAHPLAARFGTAVRFLGYDLASTSVARGSDAEIVYHFAVDERVPAGFRPFFHLEGPGAFLNLDHVPLEGAYPPERWRPGQRLRDRQRISFAPSLVPGVYTLYAGFFRRGQRLPVTPAAASDGANRVRVVSFVVR
jgi:arylsulfatase A-like enzyme